ncbi:MAG: hypothetical protein JRH18_02880 [Deltaproteobacteria bacterium]|nr:hypothetical protein [Deltaproteobacteria bacterium]MBW2150593.1 hypothetical protein [Deltaproteobacteria bacterium]
MVKEKPRKSGSTKNTNVKKKAAAGRKTKTVKEAAANSKTTAKVSRGKKTATSSSAEKKTRTTERKTSSRKKVSTRELLFKKFDSSHPANIFRVNPPEKQIQQPSSSRLETLKDRAEAQHIRSLLFRKFDLSASSNNQQQQENPPTPVQTVASAKVSKPSEPMSASLKLFLLGFVLLMALVVKVSATNRTNYYLIPTESGVEVWQGIFAPMGERRLASLPGAISPEPSRKVYSKQEVYTYIFNYYLKKADELLEQPGIPDFEKIKSYLKQAMPYGTTDKLRHMAEARLNNIDQMILLYKAEVSASKNTLADYEAALQYLQQAATLDRDGTRAGLIKRKVNAIRAAIAKLEEEQTDAETDTQPSK